MRKIFIVLAFIVACMQVSAQKKPLDHSVYDGWQSIGEKLLSNNGKVIVYTILPQEGDGQLVIQSSTGNKLKEVERGYAARITDDSRFIIFKIKPTFQQSRTARIQKKSPADMPKDSLGIYNVEKGTLEKIARVKNFKIADKNANVLVYLMEKQIAEQKKPEIDSLTRVRNLSKLADSLLKAADSIKNRLAEVQQKGINILQGNVRPQAKTNDEPVEEGTELIVLQLNDNTRKSFKLVNDYVLSKNGNVLVFKTTRSNTDKSLKATVQKFNIQNGTVDLVLSGLNDAKNFALDEDARQLAFVAERDSAAKALQKFYKLYYYTNGYDSAQLIADRNTKGLPSKWVISEFSAISFSKSGKRLFFGTAPVIPPKDTTVPDFEKAGLDVWNYKDDDLMPVQLFNLDKDLKKSYLARYDFDQHSIIQLASPQLERVIPTAEGDGNIFYASTDFGKRIAKQWQGYSLTDVYTLNPLTGEKNSIVKNFKGTLNASYNGAFLLMYASDKKGYLCYDSRHNKLNAVAKDIPYPLYDEEYDMPEYPAAYGTSKWIQEDKNVLIYDRFDIWKIDPAGIGKSVNITVNGRKEQIEYRIVNADTTEKYFSSGSLIVIKGYNRLDKSTSIYKKDSLNATGVKPLLKSNFLVSNVVKSAASKDFVATIESFSLSPDLYFFNENNTLQKLSSINPQQSQYLWGSAEIYKWKAYTGKLTEGVLYKPENFDPKKKYPMIVYFYERNNNTLHNYAAPAPTPSRLNIPFFVSRGYIVFVPDIWYTTGHPGNDAYNYIVSGTRALIKEGFVDSTKLGIQGQSWGGYQTAYVITKTNLFAAAWAGAPVVNMFSAYGGIRWESGISRQFQYEHSQSRIGATPWEKRELYIENSPLFHLPNIKTPLVIMSNDADGAVPWYQGIEFFTDMRRLNKPVWLLVYNGEQHNLVERKNRKDISIREQQYFDWLLKGDKPAKWITDGVPAIMKGKDWGLNVE